MAIPPLWSDGMIILDQCFWLHPGSGEGGPQKDILVALYKAEINRVPPEDRKHWD